MASGPQLWEARFSCSILGYTRNEVRAAVHDERRHMWLPDWASEGRGEVLPGMKQRSNRPSHELVDGTAGHYEEAIAVEDNGVVPADKMVCPLEGGKDPS